MVLDVEVARERSRKGPRYLMLSRVAVLASTLISTVVLARLVPPSEYGLAVMALVVLTFAQTFRDVGVTQAVLRKGRITPAELNLIFWITVASTSLVSGVVMASSPLLAEFFREPAVAGLLAVAVAGFFLSGVTLQHRALLERDLRFGAVALADIAGAVASLVTGVSLAVLRHDAWAIVLGSVVQSLVAGLLVVGISRWCPSRPRRDPNLWDLLKFGANATVYSTSVLASNQAASVIVGHAMGSAALGQYNRAQMLYAMPASNIVQPFARAAMPLLLRLREHPGEYRDAYAGLVRRLSVFLIPLGVTLACVALPLTSVLLGPRWEAAGQALAALAPSLAFMGLSFAVTDVLVTQNRSQALRNLGLVEAVFRIGAVLVGAQFGLVTTALAFTLATAGATVARVVVAGRVPPVSITDQLQAALPGLLTGSGAALAALVATALGVGDLSSWAKLLTLGVSCTAAALTAAASWSPARRAVWELADILGLVGVTRRVRRRVRSSR